jgi:valyl-tRNA synthetase
MNVPPSIKCPVYLREASPQTMARAAAWAEAVGRLARASAVAAAPDPVPKGSAQIVLDEATVILPLADLIDLGAERTRLERERGRAADEVEKVVRKLQNADFVARAKPEIVEENRERERTARLEVARLEAALARLG